MNIFLRYKKHITLVMVVVTAVMILDVIYQLQMHVRWRISLNQPATTTQPTEEKKKEAPKPLELSSSLKKRNIFIEPPPTGHGLTLAGVMGRMAVFHNRSGQTFTVEEGKSANGVTVKSIHNFEVEIEYQGKSEIMRFSVGGQQPGMMGPGPSGGPNVVYPAPQTAGPIKTTVFTNNATNQINNELPLNRNVKPCTTAP